MNFAEWVQDFGGSLSTRQLSLLIATALMSTSMWLLLPSPKRNRIRRRIIGGLAGLAGLSILWYFVPRMPLTVQSEFYALAALTIVCAVATVTSRNPVQSAIWFAASLLGTAGLLLFQGAQFLGVATVAVYAGAIVVTFLFLLMLAQPGGQAYFDRMSWGRSPRFVAAVAAACLLVVVAASLAEMTEDPDEALRRGLERVLTQVDSTSKLRAVRLGRENSDVCHVRLRIAATDDARSQLISQADELRQAAAESLPEIGQIRVSLEFVDVLASNHVAHFGGQLFGRHLIAVQIAAVLLLMALVGAIAIAGRDSEQQASGDAS